MARKKTSLGPELLIPLERDGPEPLHRQLEHGLRSAVRGGRLAAGTRLPSSRSLAAELGLSRGVVVEAYEQLVAEGYLASKPGGATAVAAAATRPAPPPPKPETIAEPRVDFKYGRPDVNHFPRAEWLRCLRRVLNEAPSERLSYLEKAGSIELRSALAAYLNRVRGTAADAGHVVITAGFAQGVWVVGRALVASGARRIAVEDPSEDDAVRSLRSLGLEVVGIPVGPAGIRVDLLAPADVDAVLVTSAHQFPTGAVMTAEARAALVAWAAARDGIVIEDDYDAEYRYDREPIGAIQGLDPDHVVYAGSASKTLAPGLRLGWLVLPDRLVGPVAATKYAADRGSPAIDQLAFADFLVRGEFDRHLRRMRPIYRARRDALLEAFARHTPNLRPIGASAGLHVVAWLPDGVAEDAVVAAAARVGVGVHGLAPYRIAPADDRAGGLLFGYGHLTERQIDVGIGLLATALASVGLVADPDRSPTSSASGRSAVTSR